MSRDLGTSAETFPTFKGAAGGELYRKICRFCLRAAARLREREKKALLNVPTALFKDQLTTKKDQAIARRLEDIDGQVMTARHL
jgi:hypothetical protein